ncbi:hypothetical protein, partial [Klebsiella pneumoniae]|uniref:hypothetical protein n=1 Tax=Klebsiella pneumoniae TaxID=573 RepID=UPI003EDFE1A9
RALPTGYDTREAVALLNRTQGVGLFEDDYVARRLGRDDALALAAFEGERFVGVSVIERIDDFAYHAPFDRGLPAELAGRRVASFT